MKPNKAFYLSLTISFIFCPIIIFSQYKIFYQYSFIPDLSKKDSLIEEVMVLDIDFKLQKSIFYNDKKIKVDSIISLTRGSNQKKIEFPDYNPNLTYKIKKDLIKNNISFHLEYGGVKMKITENQKPIWKISTDKMELNELVCQKATTMYKGREWIAWFTSDIPVSEGPYKFYGLPGLIVKISDKNNEHIFNLLKILKDQKNHIEDNDKNEKEINKEMLTKILNTRYENVNQNIKNFDVTNTGYTIILNDGNVIHMNKDVKDVEKELEKKVQRQKNPIDLIDGY